LKKATRPVVSLVSNHPSLALCLEEARKFTCFSRRSCPDKPSKVNAMQTLSRKTMTHGALTTTLGLVAAGAFTVLVIATGCSKDSSAAPRENVSPATANVATVGAGSHVDGKNFKLDVTAEPCKAKAECKLSVLLEATGDFHINKEYPYKLKAEGQGVVFKGTDAAGPNVFSKGAGDFKIDEEKKATMTVKYVADKPGNVTINGTYKMSVCSKDSCQLETQELSMSVVVKP
jgi:hypothetical protein